jgi:RNA 2',3'-cyclic 3'-phosphodiesterase
MARDADALAACAGLGTTLKVMTRGATARLFVAVDLPALVRAELARWGRAAALSARQGAGRLRLLDPELLHVTLCFLGEQPTRRIAAVAQSIADFDAAPVGELSLGAPLWLPPRRPHALAIELHDDAEGALESLYEDLARALATICEGFVPERRRFRPHITVARLRPRDAPRERRLPATPALSFLPVALTLYRSWLSPSGASYEGLATNTLVA